MKNCRNRLNSKKSAQRGFTLIELMVVLAIIGILAALVVPNVLGRADDARVSAAKTDVGNLLLALQAKPTVEPIPANWRSYLDKLPTDPWGNPYQYLNPGANGEVDVLSFGADGAVGGEGKNADIGSWE
jgi:general secretion pathway protein G